MTDHERCEALAIRVQDTCQFLFTLMSAHTFQASPRMQITTAYAMLVLEYCDATGVLARSGNDGSMMVMLRAVVEASFSGLWCYRCATEQHLQDLWLRDDAPFTQFKFIVPQLEGAYLTPGVFASIGEQWKDLNSFTHSGANQLRRRIQKDGNVSSNYPPKEIRAALRFAVSSALTMYFLLFQAFGFDNEVVAIQERAKKLRPYLID